MTRFAGVLALVLALLPGLSAAQMVVEAPGRLADEDFHRLVACAAPPGGECTQPLLRWPTERPIRVALRRIDPAYLGRPKQRADAALTRAVQALNGADAGFRLARVPADVPAEIEIYFLDVAAGDTLTDGAIPGLDGFAVGEVSSRLAVDTEHDQIRRAILVVSTTLPTPAYEAAMLSALTRTMGLMAIVTGPAYDRKSVLAADTGGLTELAPQDIAALRRHYATPAQ